MKDTLVACLYDTEMQSLYDTAPKLLKAAREAALVLDGIDPDQLGVREMFYEAIEEAEGR